VSDSQSETFEILVLVPGSSKEVEVAEGTTLRELAEQVGLPAENVSALDGLNNRLDAEAVIEPGMEAISFVLNLAGA
jgi:hypothetical protein